MNIENKKKSRILPAIIATALLSMTHSGISSAAVDTVFICNLKSGSSMADLMPAVEEWVAEIRKMPGGKDMGYRFLTPVAAQANAETAFIAVTSVADWDAYAKISKAYPKSKTMPAIDARMGKISSCESTSIWNSAER